MIFPAGIISVAMLLSPDLFAEDADLPGGEGNGGTTAKEELSPAKRKQNKLSEMRRKQSTKSKNTPKKNSKTSINLPPDLIRRMQERIGTSQNSEKEPGESLDGFNILDAARFQRARILLRKGDAKLAIKELDTIIEE
ncbi:MAG: hypothetical protein QF886_24340, partial [Planctomycetota bacterium]|nr:hypothetical protein [Planctomycetota bacterium]